MPYVPTFFGLIRDPVGQFGLKGSTIQKNYAFRKARKTEGHDRYRCEQWLPNDMAVAIFTPCSIRNLNMTSRGSSGHMMNLVHRGNGW
jgi:hypothetical protein